MPISARPRAHSHPRRSRQSNEVAVEAMRKPAGSQPRTRTLTANEIGLLWNGLPKALARSTSCQRIIKLCLITGQRVGEVAGVEITEFDLDANQWNIPGRRTKNAHAHTVPLSNLAIKVIREAIADANGSRFVFPAGDGPLPARAVARTILRAQGRFGIAAWSAHDLRRTALNGMAGLGVAPHVLGHVANHRSVTRATVTTQHYVTHRYDAEVRAAMWLWSDRVEAIVNGEPTAADIPIGAVR
jgi:integrase